MKSGPCGTWACLMLTEAELAAVKAKYPISRDVETLSRGGDSVLKPTGLTPSACAAGPVLNNPSPGIQPHEPPATNIRSARKARGKANLVVEDPGQVADVERRAWNAALVSTQAQVAHSGRFLVRVISHRRNLLDEDNLCEKYHIDGLRYSGLLPSDDPGRTHIEVSQQKAEPGAEEEVEIEIIAL